MFATPLLSQDAPNLRALASSLLHEKNSRFHRQTSRLFAGFLILQWVVATGLLTWSSVHSQGGSAAPLLWWSAVLLGGGLFWYPIWLALYRPTAAWTRHAVAIAQMTLGMALIHLLRGHFEFHLFVFGSLALLAFYRDWKVLITGTVTVATGGLIGIDVWPEWRWAEHMGWILFEDALLILAIRQHSQEMTANVRRQAGLEKAHATIEEAIRERTVELTRRTEELRETEARFRNLADTVPQIVLGAGPDRQIDLVSRQWRDYTGHESATQDEMREVAHPAELPDLLEQWAAGDAAGRPFEAEVRLRRAADGEYRWFLWRGVPILGTDSRVLYWYVTATDIDDRKRAEKDLARTLDLLRAVTDANPDAVYVKDRGGRYLLVNAAAARSLGLTVEEVVGRTGAALFEPETARRIWESERRIMEIGATVTHEETLRLGGKIRHLMTTKAPYRDARNEVVGVIGVARDITDRKRAEEALRESEDRLRRVLNDLPVAAYTCDAKGLITFFNRQAAETWGRAPNLNDPADRFCGAPLLLQPNGEPLAHSKCWMAVALAEGRAIHGGEVVIERPDGEQRSALEYVNLLWDSAGRMVGGVNVVIDITDRMRAEEALRRSEERFRNLVEQATDAIFLIDSNGIFVDVNRRACESLGYSREELLGKTVPDVDVDVSPDQYRKLWEHLLANKRVSVYGHHLRKDGTTFPVEVRGSLLDVDERKFTLAMVRDISDRERAEAALRASEERYRLLFEANPHPMWVFDEESLRFLAVNDAAVRHYGYSRDEFLATTVRSLSPPGSPTLDTVPPRTRARLCHHRLASDQIRQVEVAVHAIQFDGRSARLVLAQDVTEQKLLEEQLKQAQKLESIGQLAAGIAHEINTPIQYIGDNTNFLANAFGEMSRILSLYQSGEDTDRPSAAKVAAEEADIDYFIGEVPRATAQTLEGVSHVARIVKAMKEFAHPGADEKTPVDLNHAIQTVITVARNEWKYVAEVVTDLDPDLAPIPGLPGELNQVFLNLLINAVHAIRAVGASHENKGAIRISTRRAGNLVEVRIADTGCGIPEGIRSRVFDPFFTTKPVGQGTGQGLAIAHAVVTQRHGGAITFESQVGAGTTFIVRLPASGSCLTRSECVKTVSMFRKPWPSVGQEGVA